ncbi:site-specific integrase [Advenella sp. S44]|uniref:site-specific integrase n=1 Tax=Advenella sp. S44 TaxID=1982755 RepID=UPI0013747F75|nr:site-specific integrase [Advenella sp. S44]
MTKTDARILLSNIQLEWMHQVCRFAHTGAHANEILSLTWDKVDIDRKLAWVTNDLAKNGRSRPMPLNSEAIALLQERESAGTEHCFTRESGVRVTQVDKRTLDRAAILSGIKPLKFHDLRHTWASWHVQSGTPLMVLKELGGWETIEMVQKYAHLDAGHLANYVDATEFTPHQGLRQKNSRLTERLIY